MDPIRIARPEQSKEMRQEKRAYRKKAKELDKAPVEYKRRNGIFYQQNKLS
jgi:hypothetical protein